MKFGDPPFGVGNTVYHIMRDNIYSLCSTYIFDEETSQEVPKGLPLCKICEKLQGRTTSTIEHYAVRHKTSGLYLPPHPKGAGGATRMKLGVTPRLFVRPQDAIGAARWWARGITSSHTNFGGFAGADDYDTWLETKHVVGRFLEDLELVTISLQVSVIGRPIKPLQSKE